jgi:hypothetical protein
MLLLMAYRTLGSKNRKEERRLEMENEGILPEKNWIVMLERTVCCETIEWDILV